MNLFNQAMKRPANYHNLPEERKWEIDKRLGILDWDGSCSHKQKDMCKECLTKYMEAHNG
jgi:hypothetical protein